MVSSTFILDNTVQTRGAINLILKRDLNAGSSKQGNARRASVLSN